MKRWLRNLRARRSLRSRCGHLPSLHEPMCEKKPTYFVRNLAGTKLWYCDDHGFGMFLAIGQAEASLARGERPDIQALAKAAISIEASVHPRSTADGGSA